MSSFSNYYENRLLNNIFGKQAWTSSVISVGLCRSPGPNEASTGGNCNEVPNANGYARVQTSSAYWSIATAGAIVNTLNIVFPEALGVWGTITHFILATSPTWGGGDIIMYGQLYIATSFERGSIPKFLPSTLMITLD